MGPMTRPWGLGALAALMLGGCDIAPEVTQGAQVPIPALLAETRALPYECLGYEAASDSCESLSRMSLQGSAVISRGQFVVSPAPRITAEAVVAFQLTADGRACGNFSGIGLSFTGLPEGDAQVVADRILREIFAGTGDVCVSYFRAGPDAFITELRDPDGALLPEGRDVVRFFATPKPLRIVRR